MAFDLRELRITPEDEIKELERKLEEKKRELAEQGKPVGEEKEVFREVLQQHIEAARPALSEPQPQTPQPLKGIAHTLADDLKKKVDDVKSKTERDEKIKALLELALTHTIQDAVKVAEAASPYLLDELHDHLVDDYYQKLIALRKIKEL